jgi:hypothetical protein
VSADPGRRYFSFTAALVVLLAAACSDTRGGPIPYDQTLAAPDTPSLATLESNYKIAPMDKLTVKVFKSDDMSGDYDVDLTGHISLPLVGEVEAGLAGGEAGGEALEVFAEALRLGVVQDVAGAREEDLLLLGRVEEGTDRPESAVELYERVVSVDIRFRDTAQRIERLRK